MAPWRDRQGTYMPRADPDVLFETPAKATSPRTSELVAPASSQAELGAPLVLDETPSLRTQGRSSSAPRRPLENACWSCAPDLIPKGGLPLSSPLLSLRPSSPPSTSLAIEHQTRGSPLSARVEEHKRSTRPAPLEAAAGAAPNRRRTYSAKEATRARTHARAVPTTRL